MAHIRGWGVGVVGVGVGGGGGGWEAEGGLRLANFCYHGFIQSSSLFVCYHNSNS